MRSTHWPNGEAGTRNLGTGDTRKDLCFEALMKTFREVWEESMFHSKNKYPPKLEGDCLEKTEKEGKSDKGSYYIEHICKNQGSSSKEAPDDIADRGLQGVFYICRRRSHHSWITRPFFQFMLCP